MLARRLLSSGAFFVGDPQQGKSRLHGYIAGVLAAVDEYVADLAQQKLDSLDMTENLRKPSSLTVNSIGFQSITMAELFARCNGDWPLVEEFPTWKLWFSRIGNLDEAYELLKDLGLCGVDSRTPPSKEAGPCAHASTLNTLLGTGKTQRSTRSSGSYGSSKTPPVNVDILANLHWKMLTQMERGATGNHVQATKERFLYCAGRADKRHDALPDGYPLPPGVPSRWTWLPLTSHLAHSFGWEPYYQSPERAQEEAQTMPP